MNKYDVCSCKDSVFYVLFQNSGVRITNTVNISKRPMSIKAEHIHLAKAGNMLQDIVGPICKPKVGPTLLKLLNAIVMAFVLSIPIAMNIKEAITMSIKYMARKAKSVTLCLISTFAPSTFNGKTAFGCNICLN